MFDLSAELKRWFYRNLENASIIYIGKKQQEEIKKEFKFQWREGDKYKLTKYHGYKVVYVDEEDYLRLGD